MAFVATINSVTYGLSITLRNRSRVFNGEIRDAFGGVQNAFFDKSIGRTGIQARRTAANPDMKKGDLDDFLNQLDIGGIGHESKGIARFNSVDEIVDFFTDGRDKPEDWRQRD